MYPTTDRLLQSVKSSLEDMIVPDLSSPYPVFTSRIIGTMCDYMQNRSTDESKAIIDSSNDIKETLISAMSALEELGKFAELIDNTKHQINNVRTRDIYYSTESLIYENFDLKEMFISFKSTLHNEKEVLTYAQYKDLTKTLNSCTYRLLQREYNLIAPMVEFQKSIYNMG